MKFAKKFDLQCYLIWVGKRFAFTLVSLLILLMSASFFFNAIRKALRNANRFPTSAPRTLDPGAEAVAVAGSSGQERGLYLGRGVQGRQAGSELWGLQGVLWPRRVSMCGLVCRRRALPSRPGSGPQECLCSTWEPTWSPRRGRPRPWRPSLKDNQQATPWKSIPRGPRWPAALQGSGPGNGRGGWAEGNFQASVLRPPVSLRSGCLAGFSTVGSSKVMDAAQY